MEKKVLIIDDEPEMLKMISYALEKAGFKTATCDSGKQALSAISAHKPDLLILDVMLPGIDGYSLGQQIAENPETRTIPIIVLTALEPSKPLFQKFTQVVAFMTKPCDVDALVSQVQKSVGHATA